MYQNHRKNKSELDSLAKKVNVENNDVTVTEDSTILTGAHSKEKLYKESEETEVVGNKPKHKAKKTKFKKYNAIIEEIVRDLFVNDAEKGLRKM